MASPLVDVIAQIATTWAALIPEGSAAPSYGYLGEHLPPDGVESAAGMHRMFWFEPASGAPTREFGGGASQLEHRFSAGFVRSHDGRGAKTRFEELTNECVQLMRAVNTEASWPAGVDSVRCDGYAVRRYDETGATAEFSLVAYCEES